MGGLDTGSSDFTGGKMGVSDIWWLETGRAVSCLEGAGIGSGSIWAGICADGDGAIRIGAGAGEDIWAGSGAGELCLVGENDGRGR